MLKENEPEAGAGRAGAARRLNGVVNPARVAACPVVVVLAGSRPAVLGPRGCGRFGARPVPPPSFLSRQPPWGGRRAGVGPGRAP